MRNILCSATYIWLGGNQELRGKTQTLILPLNYRLDQIPNWKFDGSSTDQALGEDSDVFLKPVYTCPNPFVKSSRRNNLLVLCETFIDPLCKIPHTTNLRRNLAELMERYRDHEPWAGFEQEWFPAGSAYGKIQPLAWLDNSQPEPQGKYYSSVGIDDIGGEIRDEHYNLCLDAGLSMAGINPEVAPSQHEFQIGPINGQDALDTKNALTACDELIIARWILHKVTKLYGLGVSLDPKPVPGKWNGSGCHTNFSTREMREESGLNEIYKAAEKLKKNHAEQIKAYGEGNEERLSGKYETSDINECEIGVAHRGKAIRIPSDVALEGRGYMEIRQPAANCSPYLVITSLIETILGDGYKYEKTG